MKESESTATIYLALGSNLGDRQGTLDAIRQQLPPAVEICQVSALYETEPWGYLDQPKFLNQVLKAVTNLAPLDLLEYVKGIERSLDRQPTHRYGPRTADIDIIFYGDEIITEEQLTIPHPRFKERAFVLVPMVEIAPDLEVPGSDQSLTDLLQGLDTSGVERYQE